jgi:hypothetical protein
MVRRTYLTPDHAFTERPSLLSRSGRLVSRRRHGREYSATTDYVLIHGAWQTLDTLRRPEVEMHNRMKEAVVLLGKLPRAVARPPLVKISDAENYADQKCADRGRAARRPNRTGARRGIIRAER